MSVTVEAAIAGSLLPRADAEILLARVVKKDRTWLLAHPEYSLTPEEWTTYAAWVGRRRASEPVAYILGEQEFYGRPFFIDRRVLIPRPATEGVIRRAVQFLEDGRDAVDDVDAGIVVVAKNIHHQQSGASARSPELVQVKTVVDIGTGSGCIGITLALERPDLTVILTDVSADALAVAQENIKRHHVADRVTIRQGNGLGPIQDLGESFLLVSNPPYIPRNRTLMPDVQDFEPHVALFGGSKGTDLIRAIWNAASTHPCCIGVVMECEREQIDHSR